MQSLRCFTWVCWGYLPSTDISCTPQFHCFLPSFLYCYLISKWKIYFFILVFSDPILFSLFLVLCSTFPIFYFLSFSSVFPCISSTFSFFFCLFLCLSSISFLAVFYLSFLTFFVYYLIFPSASIPSFVFYFPSWLYKVWIC